MSGVRPSVTKTCLVVEDDTRLRAVLDEALAALGFHVVLAGSVADAVTRLCASPPSLLLLDVALPDGRALDVLEVASRLAPSPLVIAMSGAAGPDESFALAERGVRAFLKKPLDLARLEDAIERAFSTPPDLVPHLRASVGLQPIQAIEERVRTTLVEEALAKSSGNRRSAARTLGISRQLLQHILRKG